MQKRMRIYPVFFTKSNTTTQIFMNIKRKEKKLRVPALPT